MPSIEFTHYYSDDENADAEKVITLPAKYVVCSDCEGTGKSSAYLGAFTQTDMFEMGEDFMDDYMRGHYDRPCEECKGDRVVLEVDEEKADPLDLKFYNEYLYDKYQDEQVHRMEMQAEYGPEYSW